MGKFIKLALYVSCGCSIIAGVVLKTGGDTPNATYWLTQAVFDYVLARDTEWK